MNRKIAISTLSLLFHFFLKRKVCQSIYLTMKEEQEATPVTTLPKTIVLAMELNCSLARSVFSALI
jgi:hypothetical protein